ncbi:MAG: class I SAM-dependent methyltransferase, partial [Candidatus Babeliales bacterium]
GAEGDLAQVLLEHYTSIQRYAWTDFCPDAVDYVTNRLRHIRDRQLSISRVDAENVSELHFDGADMIVCTALEHIAHDQEIIKAIPQGTKVALCLPSLMWDGHLRCFQNWDAIAQRYPDLHIRDYVTMGFAKNDYNKKYLLVATKT